MPLRRALDGRNESIPLIVMPVTILLLALGLRLYGLGEEPYWLDELFTMRRVAMPIPEMISDARGNMHSPVYFLLLKGMVGWLSDEEAVLRAPSALFGAAVAAIAAIVARDVGGRCAGWTAGMLVAACPFQMLYGQEARSYTLVAAFIMLGLWGVVRIAERDGAATWRPWTAWIAGTAGALVIFNGALPWLIASAAALSLAAVSRPDTAGRVWMFRRIAGGIATILALWLPIALLVVASVASTAREGFWVPPLSPAAILDTGRIVYLFAVSEPVTFDLLIRPPAWIELLLLGLAGYGVWSLRNRPPTVFVLATALLALPCLLLAVSLLRPVYLPRYLFWSAPVFFILVGLGLAALPWHQAASGFARIPRTAASAVLVALCLWGAIAHHMAEKRPRWDVALSWLAENAVDGDLVYLEGPTSRYVFDTLRQRRPVPDLVLADTSDDALAALAAGHRVWAVRATVEFGTMEPIEDFIGRLVDLWNAVPMEEQAVGRSIYILRMEQAASS